MDNALIIDLVLTAVLALFALLGARKGLIRSLMALVSVVVALIGATLLTAMFVEPVTDLVYPKVEERVLEQFERDIPSDALPFLRRSGRRTCSSRPSCRPRCSSRSSLR